MNKRLIGGVALVIVIGLGAYWRAHHIALPDEGEMPQILKEAAGTAPIPTSDTPGRKALRDSFKHLLDENKTYQSDVDKHYIYGHLRGLLFAGTFVNGESEKIISELKELKELDQKHLTAVQQFPEVFKKNLSDAGASTAEVEAFERGMRKGMAGGLDGVTQAMNAEMQWVDATIELYQFAADNQSYIRRRGASQLEFDSEDVRLHFIELSQKVDDLSAQRDKAQEAFSGVQERNRKQLGITPQDVGQPNGE